MSLFFRGSPPKMTKQISVFHSSKLLRNVLFVEGQYMAGNDATLQVPLLFPTVSKAHGIFSISKNLTLTYQDLGSRNGTYVVHSQDKRGDLASPQRLEPQAVTVLHNGSYLLIGPFRIQISEHVKDNGHELQEYNPLWPVLENRYTQYLAENRTCDDSSLPEDLRRWAEVYGINHGLSLEDVETTVSQFLAEENGHGPLSHYMSSGTCKEILVNSIDSIYIDEGEGLTRLLTKAGTPASFRSERSIQAWVQRLVTSANRRLDLQNPICEGTLPNGGRLQAVLSPLSKSKCSVAIRRFGGAPITEEQALVNGWLTSEALNLLKNAVIQKKNILISGGTGSGKTSLLNFLCRYIGTTERLITIEDTLELTPSVENIVALQARRANADGIGDVTLRHLLQCALRMRPDRIIVGECRGNEVIEMLQALNTGHPGSLTTVHANSPKDAVDRVMLLALMGAPNLSENALTRWITSSIDLIVQVKRFANGNRAITSIAQVDFEPMKGVLVNEIYEMYNYYRHEEASDARECAL